MKIKLYSFLVLVLINCCHPLLVNASENIEETLHPIETCTDGVSIEKFLAEFNFEKINKVALKEIVLNQEKKFKTIRTLNKKKDIKFILSALNKLQCEDFCLCGGDNEIWLYENDTLILKLAVYVTKTSATIKFFRPEDFLGYDDQLGNISYDFFIVDEKLCSWLYSLFEITDK